MHKHFSKNGNLFPINKAVIPLSNIEYAYGYGIYELIKVKNRIPYFADQHVERLFKSAKILEIITNLSKNDVKKYINDLIFYEKEDTYNLKLILLGAKKLDDCQLFIMPQSPLFPDRKFYKYGISTITYHYERLFPNAKTLNMLGSYLAYKKAKGYDCYDALLINNKGIIMEGTRTNFYAVKDKTVFTQPNENILEGVTREIVLNIAKKYGYQIENKDITIKDLKNFDCAFLTSTSSKILPIRKIDEFVFPDFPETLKFLMKKYDDFLSESKGVFNSSK